eukprot:224201-Amphidinium_carterae.1
MVYVDDLLLIGPDSEIQRFLKTLAEVLQLKHVTKIQSDTPLIFLGRQLEYYNNCIVMNMTKEYYSTFVQLYNTKESTNSLATTGNE